MDTAAGPDGDARDPAPVPPAAERVGDLKPVPRHVAPQCRELALALRGVFAGLRLSVRRYALRRHHDPGTVSRYLNGTAVAPAEFVERLLEDAAQALGRPVSAEVTARVTALQREALRATNKLGWELQLLRDRLAEADRRQRAAETNVEALTEALHARKRRIAELEAGHRRATARLEARHAAQEDEAVRTRAAQQRLRTEAARLRTALEEARGRAAAAERRCAELERQLAAAEEFVARTLERGPGAGTTRFTISFAGPDRFWAVWVRHRLEINGHEAALQRWEPPAGLSLRESLRALLIVEGTHVLLLGDGLFATGPHPAAEWTEALREQPGRLAVFAVTDPAAATCPGLEADFLGGVGAEEAERRILERLGLDTTLAGVRTGASAPRFPAEPPHIWGGVPDRDPGFTGREELLAHLGHHFDEGRSGAAVCVLAGMPGVGKTRLAAEYAHRFAAQYDVVWWIPAGGGPPAVRARLAALHDALAAPGATGTGGPAAPADRARAVLGALRRGAPYSRWLIVLDGADDPRHTAGLLPSGPGHVLITSQHGGWAAPEGRVLQVPPFDRAESVRYVRRRLPRVGRTEAELLAAELGDHPLAVAQAVAYLDAEVLPVPRYLDRLRDTSWERAPLTATGDYPTTFSRALTSVLGRLRETHPEAVELLHVCALFADGGAPPALLRISLPEPLRGQCLDPRRWQALVAVLVEHFLAGVWTPEDGEGGAAPTGSVLRMHPLVRRVVRDEMPGGYRIGLLRRVRHALAAADPCDPANVRVWPQYARIVPHLEPSGGPGEAGEENAALVLNCVRYLHLRGDSRTASHLLERMARTWRGQLGDGHPWTAAIVPRRTEVLRALGSYRRAAAADRAELARLRAADAPATAVLAAAGDVGADLRGLGRYREALEYAREQYDGRAAVLGRAHPATLEAAGALADSLRLLGRYAEALRLSERTAAGYQRLPEPQDLWRLRAEGRHALDLRLLGHYESALGRQLATTQAHRELLGAEHPLTLSAEHGLALCELRNDAVGEGLVRLREVRDAAERVLGPTAPPALMTAASHACAERTHGDPDEGLSRCDESLRRHRSVYGPGHPCTAGALTNYAVALRTVGETGRARALNEEALRSLTATLGEDHPWTLGAAYNLCADHEHGPDPGGAPELSRTTAERATRTLGARHPWALLAWAAHAAVLRLTGAADEAGAVEARALAGLTETLGGGHRLTVAAGTGRRPVWTFDPLPG
ncbi:FxSxx-COOH system tetratricopeptide repeat protein [Streptomyces sp. NRRL F-5755]|uniref:FxSxx-COOH system tetratricopeptide repeat protein n=1 Tax=Streptomyces sp. NRRL F-5755 TaxID=1519475 RepID=UPI0006AF4C62|nr:FxSxx-COOH system tetratricopeptide repeat protein [Streptomyces sp. NRRL F-5755]